MIRARIRKMLPYSPPLEGRSQSGLRLLDFNERTRGVSTGIKQALIDYVNSDRLQVYPEYGNIVERIAQYAGVANEELMLSNGSDQGIDVIFRTVAEPGDEAIVPIPTFAMLTHSAEVCGLDLKCPVYTEDYRYPLDDVLAAVSEKTRIIVVCNPNSPTGTLVEAADIVRLANTVPQAAILVDECYFEYSRTTVKDSINACPNIFITRTFSKTWGLPSLRIGYVLTCSENINNLLKVRGPYDVNTLAVVAVQAALDDPYFMETYVEEVLSVSRPRLLGFLQEKGIRYWPSEANFVLIYPPDSKHLLERLEEQNIRVRPRKGPGIDGTLRLTIGTKEDTEALISVLERSL